MILRPGTSVLPPTVQGDVMTRASDVATVKRRTSSNREDSAGQCSRRYVSSMESWLTAGRTSSLISERRVGLSMRYASSQKASL